MLGLFVVTAMVLAACGTSDSASSTTEGTSPTTTTAVPSATAVGGVTSTTVEATTTAGPTTTTVVAVTSTTVETTTSTTLDAALAEHAGLWQWAETDQKLMRLEVDGSLAIGYTLDGVPQLGLRGAVGEWEIVDGGISITGLGIGDCPDVVGTYEIDVSEDGFVMSVLDDECSDRVRWLLGSESTSHAWIPSEP
jgi:hypothetical protein